VALPQIKAGKLAVLAQSGTARSPELADVPLFTELIPDMPALPGWYALVGPGKLPPDVARKLGLALQSFLSDPEIKTTLLNQFLFPMSGNGEDMRARAADEAAFWGGLIKDLDNKLD
jgi:tripartite-type tricarboxylate transporter receptor subunit TctC